MALVEREHELARLEAAIAEATSGRGSTVVIEGPPGIGKTALLDHTRLLASSKGMRVLSASAAELESDLGFAVVRGMFEDVLASIDAADREEVLAGAAHLAVGPLGMGGEIAPAPVEIGSAMHGIYWLSANLADREPLLLAVDDLHWADTPSLLVLTYLARRVTELPIVICATTRPPENEPTGRYLTALGAEPTEVLQPGPLSDAGVAEVVSAIFSAHSAPEFSEASARASGGNPFLLVEALTALQHEGIAPTADHAGRLGDVRPETLTRSLLVRVNRLGPEATRVGRAVAILGVDAELRRVAELARMEPETVANSVSGLRREGILNSNGRLDFIHPLVRTAVYSDIAEPDRGLAHLRAARILDEDGHHERVPTHLLLAESNGDAWVVDRLRDAASSAMTNGAPASAAALLERAMAEPAPAEERPIIGTELGRARTREGRLDAAVDAFELAHELTPGTDERAAIALELGMALRLSGRTTDAITLLDRTVHELPAGHGLQMALETEIAMAGHLGLPAKEWVDRLAGVVQRAGGPSLVDRTLRAFYAYVAASTGTQSVDDVDRLARSSITSLNPGDPPLLLQTAAAGLAMSGSYREALEVLDQALDTAREVGDGVQFGFVSQTRSWVSHRAGRVLECEADARAGLAVAVEGALDLAYAVGTLGVALIERGQPQDAEALYAEHGFAEITEWETSLAATLFGVRSRVHRALGRPREALADIERCRDTLAQVGFTSPTFIEWPHDLVLTHLALGDVDAAREVAAEEVAITREFGAPRELGIALRSSGLVEGGQRGLDLLTESIDVLAGSEGVLDHAKSLVERGAALRRAGQRVEARDQLSQGLDAASRCGSGSVVTRARDELTAAGARPRRERLSGPDSLTASEMRVAKLAAEGRSNPEIAQALFVTRRTVEVHLTHAYRKLGIESRDALPSALRTDET